MSKKVVITLLENIEELAPLLDKLPEVTYTLLHASSENLTSVIEKNLSLFQSSVDGSFVIVLSKKSYQKEGIQRSVAEVLTSSGVKAEPIFLVADKEFTWEEIDHIICHSHLFYTIPGNKRTLLSKKNVNCFRGFVDKAMLDYGLNKKLIELISVEFLSFIEKEELKMSKEEIEQLNMELETKNRIDELTQLLNRKGILEYFHMAKGRTTRERWRLKAQSLQERTTEDDINGVPEGDIEDFFGHLSCMMIDIDNFKKINDTYGHIVGDDVLRGIGTLFSEEGIFRKEDVCGRFGGEEFVVILPATNAQNAVIPAEKLRKTIKCTEFASPEGETFSLTVSIGVAELEASEESIEELINKADIALYEAKQTGKDKTVVYEPGRMSTDVVGQHAR
jgi:diguanylate cyclase (GGDEF)-like protein